MEMLEWNDAFLGYYLNTHFTVPADALALQSDEEYCHLGQWHDNTFPRAPISTYTRVVFHPTSH